MRKIQMSDLRAQYDRIKPEIDSAIQSVINSTAFIKGPEVTMFEEELREYNGVKHVVSCANGTDALRLALMALGLKAGDEVITSNFTFIATVESIAMQGLKPVLIDPDHGSFNVTAESIKKAITPRTRAIMPVHLFGQCADMENIMELARQHSLYVIEDAAQATGADFIFSNKSVKKAGSIGHIGATSFFPSKNLGCYGDGGALYTNDDGIAGKLRSIANHGMKVRYCYDDIGVNSRLDTVQAAILRVKLRYHDLFNDARRTAADFYDRALAACTGIETPRRMTFSTHIFNQYTIKVKDGRRDGLKKFLESKNIPSMVYYPSPLHSQDAYKYLGCGETDFPVTAQLCKQVISLPIHSEMEQQQLEYITDAVLEFFK
ncbi:MAG: DegT/DnrJ/EryC1/StrS family aminotransferase [Bacteroidales bacterium]|jgi:dTDP-4-amino-4,6-dideoxygalactose transaminase|nr:DegT/DnrJ/EryC1/StrS family aminotransferase [Bacteroidales bacterium]